MTAREKGLRNGGNFRGPQFPSEAAWREGGLLPAQAALKAGGRAKLVIPTSI